MTVSAAALLEVMKEFGLHPNMMSDDMWETVQQIAEDLAKEKFFA